MRSEITPSVARLITIPAVFFVSFSAILIRLSGAPSLAIAAWRLSFAAILMVPILGVGRLHGRYNPGSTDPPRGRSFSAYGAATVSGLFLALHFATWITSLELTSVIHSTVLVTMHPLIVIIASALVLGERASQKTLAGASTAIIGAILLASGGSIRGIQPTFAGNGLALIGAFAVAGYMVIGRWARRSMDAAVYNLVVYAVAAVVLLLATLVADVSLGPYPMREYLLFFLLAAVCTILGHGVFNWTLRYIPATEVSLAVLMEPVFASAMAAILFTELPGPVTIIGALIILFSLAVVVYDRGV